MYEAVKDGRLRIDEGGRIWRGGRRAEREKGTNLRITLRVGGRLVNTLALVTASEGGRHRYHNLGRRTLRP